MESFSNLISDAKSAVKVSNDAINEDASGSLEVRFGDYSRVYYSSNEYLRNLFNNFSVCGKKVLCVAGSGDQAFECISRGASSVDVFDINKLSKYYFYLRIWGMKYFDSYYPSIDELFNSHDWIKKVLKKVDLSSVTENEKEAFYFWSLYINEQLYDILNRKLFYLSRKPHVNTIEDVSRLNKLLEGREISFIHGDICSGSVPVDKKYDLIIMSNILEYCKGDKLVLRRTRDNLHRLLNDGGQVVCSRLLQYDHEAGSYVEEDVFEEMFSKEEFPFEMDPLIGKRVPVGYLYRKK